MRWAVPSRRWLGACSTAVLLAGAAVARGESLDRKLPNLFGGTLVTSLTSRVSTLDPTETQRVVIADRLSGLSAALVAARSQAPVPSASGAFQFAWDPDVDTFVRQRQSLGSVLAERAQTLGRHTGTLSFSYTRVNFNTLEGDQLSHLQSSQPALSAGFRAQLPPDDQTRTADDVLQTQLNFSLAYDLFFMTAAYGITDTIDVSLALSVNQIHMRAAAQAQILDTQTDAAHAGGACFVANQRGVVGSESCIRLARDGFDETILGTGDLFLRSKWHLYDTAFADFAVVGVLTLPTGNANDLLGFHDPTFTPWLIASKDIGRLSPHLNLGYAFRSGADVSQAEWIAGADFRTTNWLTLVADFLGFHDDKRDGINDDVLQSALGFKINPFDQVVIAGNFQLPLNRDGLRADVIYTGQIEYTF